MTERVTPAHLLGKLFWSSRPVSWINTAYPFGAAYLVITHRLDAVFWIGCLFFLIPYNLLMYGINDVYDYESDLRNPRKGSIEGAILDPRWHKPMLWAAYSLPIPFVIFLASKVNFFANVVLGVVLFSVIAYSAKGLRFKEIPLLDSITSATHFAGPMAVGIAMAGSDLRTGTSLKLLTAFLLWGMASHAFGAVQDVKADREAKLSSIATAFGARDTVWFAFGAYLLAGLVLLTGGKPIPFAAIAVIPYLVIVWPYRSITDDTCEQANAGWRRFIWLNFIAGFVVTMILIFATLTAK